MVLGNLLTKKVDSKYRAGLKGSWTNGMKNYISIMAYLIAKVLCFDFDDTLRSKQSDPPLQGAPEAIGTLKSKGFAIIISSARLDPVL